MKTLAYIIIAFHIFFLLSIMDENLENIVKLVVRKKKVVSNKRLSEVPQIYYIGMPKTASQSIVYGFPGISVSQWHNIKFFEKRFQTKILSENNLNLYDLIIYIGKKYNFKPLVIESIREPVGMLMSLCAQHLKFNHPVCKCELCEWKRDPNHQLDNNFLEIINRRIKVHFWKNWLQTNLAVAHCFNEDIFKIYNPNIDKKLYLENDKIKLLMIRFEDISQRKKVFEELNYNYNEVYYNDTQNFEGVAKIYDYIKKNIVFTEEEINEIYNYKLVKLFYTSDEIEFFKNKYLKK